MRRAALLISTSLAACGGNNADVEITFADPSVRPLVKELMVTVVEPFAPSADGQRDRAVVKCGEIGVFPPTARFSRDGTDIANFPKGQVIFNRERSVFPLEDGWTLPDFKLKSSAETNPWGAMMVHVEARGLVRKTQDGVSDGETRTLLEGCICLMLNDGATGSDETLDEEVKKNCAPLATEDGSKRQIQLAAVAPQEFRLGAFGITDLTAPKNETLLAFPGVLMETIRCDQQSGQRCFRCSTAACSELDFQQNVPIRVGVSQPGGGSSAVAEVILTDAEGRVVPEIRVDDCSVPLSITAHILGRPEQAVEFPVRCVDGVAFTGPDRQVPLLESDSIAGIALLPGDSQTRAPAMIAVLSKGTGEALIELFGVEGGDLRRRVDLAFPGEEPLGIFGYHYRADAPEKPILAIATEVDDLPRIRLMRFDPIGNGALVPLQEMSGVCAYNGCGHPGICADISGCTFELRNASIVMSAADVNFDGLNDLSFAADTSYSITVFLSSQSSPDAPPVLSQSCQCSSYGRQLPSYEMVQIGGPNEGGTRAAVDLMTGDTTGAYLRYGQSVGVLGSPCNTLTGTAAVGCPGGQVCAEMCPGQPSSARCAVPCNGGATSCSNTPQQPTCMPSNGTSGPGFCGGPYLSCRQPLSVWPLINVHDVTKGRISGGDFEDVIAVGSGSSLPVSTGNGGVQLFFGSTVNLTDLSHERPEVAKAASTFLVPRVLADVGEARSPRSAEVADFNNDTFNDVAVLFEASEEIRVWLGSGNHGPGEISGRARLNRCEGPCARSEECRPFGKFAAGDLDGDGRAELVAVCVPEDDNPYLLWFPPQ